MAERKSKPLGWLRSLSPSAARARAPKTTEVKESSTEGPTEAAAPKASDSGTTATKPRPSSPDTAPTDKAPPDKPPPNMQERIDGIQGWMAEIERRQGRMTYFGAAAGILALAAAAAALFLAITSKNDTSDDIDALRDDVGGVQEQVQQTTETQLKGLNDKLSTLEQQITTLNQREQQTESDIAELQSQGKAADKGLGAGANPTSPGATVNP